MRDAAVMTTSLGDFEKLGQFYLGRGYDPENRQASGDMVLHDSADIATQGVVLGATGSGKTGLRIALWEEAAKVDEIALLWMPAR